MPDLDEPDEPTPDEQPPERRSPAEQPTGRDRLRGALLRPSRGQVDRRGAAGAARASPRSRRCASPTSTTPTPSQREQDLIDVLNGLAGTTQRAERRSRACERTRDDLQSSTGARQAALAQAEQRGRHAGDPGRPGAGDRARASGSRSPRPTAPSTSTRMVDMIQELRTAGAEAIQINGRSGSSRRRRSTTPSAGSWSTASWSTSPYVVDVIGEPSTLHGAVDFPKGPRDAVRGRGRDGRRSSELDVARHRGRRAPRGSLSTPSPTRRSNLTAGASAHRPEETPCTPTT